VTLLFLTTVPSPPPSPAEFRRDRSATPPLSWLSLSAWRASRLDFFSWLGSASMLVLCTVQGCRRLSALSVRIHRSSFLGHVRCFRKTGPYYMNGAPLSHDFRAPFRLGVFPRDSVALSFLSSFFPLPVGRPRVFSTPRPPTEGAFSLFAFLCFCFFVVFCCPLCIQGPCCLMEGCGVAALCAPVSSLLA